MSELWTHQREDLECSWRLPAAALHWEPRLGKSRVTIETVKRLRDAGHVNAAVIVAPNGVHLNWTREQLPLYWDAEDSVCIEWRAGKGDTKKFRNELNDAIKSDRFVWFAVNVEGLGASRKVVNISGKGPPGVLEQFVRAKRCMLILDESHYCKNPRAKRTRAVLKIAKQCPFRRNLTGTPDPQGPFDFFSQFQILDESVFGKSWVLFKQRYGEWKRVRYGVGPLHDELVEYKNLDELAAKLTPLTFTRRKKDCLDLPPRLMKEGSEVLGVPRFYEMNPSHRAVYNQVRDELLARLDSGEEVTATNALTNLLRLQQVSRGHVGVDAEHGVEMKFLEPPYPSLEALQDVLAGHSGKAIVWCNFKYDVELIRANLMPDTVAVCTGDTPPTERVELRRRFNDPASPLRIWLGTLATGGVGVDLGIADLMVFYSHGYKLDARLQGLERNYGSTQLASRLEVVDLIAVDTVDLLTLRAVERKEDLAARLRSLL